MPLSDHEKRLLDGIEHALRADDPALAYSLRVARAPLASKILLLVGFCGLFGGLALVFAGLRLAIGPGSSVIGVVLGVAGYALIVAGCDSCLRILSRMRRLRRKRGAASELA